MERHLDQALGEIRQLLLRMGLSVEQMVERSVGSLIERDDERCRHILEQDRSIDQLQIEIDKACETVMATQQPTAVDMRFLRAVRLLREDPVAAAEVLVRQATVHERTGGYTTALRVVTRARRL